MQKVPETFPAIAAVPASQEGVTLAVGTLIQATGRWVQQAGHRINNLFPADGSESMAAPLPLAAILSGDLPAAADWTGSIVYVPDAAAGSRIQVSNGTTWVTIDSF